MLTALTLALAAPTWEPVWSGRVDEGSMPEVELIGTDEGGAVAWLRIADGPRRTRALWQIDLRRGRRTGVWTAGELHEPAFGAMAPLVQAPDDLARMALLQSHVAGRPTWPVLSVDPLGQHVAWEHGNAQGGDAVTLHGAEGDRAMGGDDLVAVYRPRFHPSEPLVVYTGSTAGGEYRVVLQHLVTGERTPIAGVGHAQQLDWDHHGGLWVTGNGCASRVPASELRLPADIPPLAEAVACGSEDLHTRTSPDGRHIVVLDPAPDEPGVLLAGRFRTEDGTLAGRARIQGGRSAQALSDDGWMLVTAGTGSTLVEVTEDARRPVPLDVAAIGGVHDHWVDGSALAIAWDPATRIVTLGWATPPG